LLTVAGLVNGCVGSGADRHLANWESVKVVQKTEEEGDRGETVIRERERFSQRLTLLYADGRIALLTETPRTAGGKDRHEERAPANGEVDVRPADP
jgi:hypothetical protein